MKKRVIASNQRKERPSQGALLLYQWSAVYCNQVALSRHRAGDYGNSLMQEDCTKLPAEKPDYGDY